MNSTFEVRSDHFFKNTSATPKYHRRIFIPGSPYSYSRNDQTPSRLNSRRRESGIGFCWSDRLLDKILKSVNLYWSDCCGSLEIWHQAFGALALTPPLVRIKSKEKALKSHIERDFSILQSNLSILIRSLPLALLITTYTYSSYNF